MRVVLLLLLAACSKQGEPHEPAPPPQPVVPAAIDPTPMQSPPASTTIHASSYAQSCTRDDECVGVFEGDGCNPCRCAFNAIHVDALSKYKSDLGQFWACSKPEDCKTDCRQVIGDAAKCEAGTCILPP